MVRVCVTSLNGSDRKRAAQREGGKRQLIKRADVEHLMSNEFSGLAFSKHCGRLGHAFTSKVPSHSHVGGENIENQTENSENDVFQLGVIRVTILGRVPEEHPVTSHRKLTHRRFQGKSHQLIVRPPSTAIPTTELSFSLFSEHFLFFFILSKIQTNKTQQAVNLDFWLGIVADAINWKRIDEISENKTKKNRWSVFMVQ